MFEERDESSGASIRSLPPDTWLILARRLDISDIWALMACGDRSLSRKLCHNSILTSLNITSDNIAHVRSFFKFNRLDKVSSLSIATCHSEILQRPEIKSLMHTLRRFDSYELKESSEEQHWLLPMQFLNQIDEIWFNVETLFPSLEELCLTINQHAPYPPTMCLRLPESLQRLDLRTPFINTHHFDLPPCLTHLNAFSFVISRYSLDALPRTITTLGCRFNPDIDWARVNPENDPLETRVSSWLPISRLRELLQCDNPDWDQFVPPEHRTAHLAEVENFHASRFKGWGYFRYLPLLTDLSLLGNSNAHGYPSRVGFDSVRCPTTIKKLSLCLAHTSLEHTTDWPSNITHLNFLFSSHHLSERSRYPKNLYRFQQSSRFTLESSVPEIDPSSQFPETLNFSALPSNLTSLTYDYKTDQPLSIIGELPRTLTHLDLANIVPCTSQHILQLTKHYSGLIIRESGIPLSEVAATMPGWDDESLQSSLDLPPHPQSSSYSPSSSSYSPSSSSSYSPSSTSSSASLPHFWPPYLTSLHLNAGCALLLDILPKSLLDYEIDLVELGDDTVERIANVRPSLLQNVSIDRLERAVRIFYDSRPGRVLGEIRFDLTVEGCFPVFREHTEKLDLTSLFSGDKQFDVSIFGGFKKLRKLVSTSTLHLPEGSHLLEFLPNCISTVDITIQPGNVLDSIMLDLPDHIHKLRISDMPMTLATIGKMFSSGDYDEELNDATVEACFVDLMDSYDGRVMARRTIFDLTLTPISCLHLPTTITSIDLPTDINNSIFYSMLPATLTNLRIVVPLAVTDVALSHLPASLLHLELTEDRGLSDACTQHLPLLKTLSLPSNSRLTSAALQTLPTSLETLNVRAASLINDIGISSLPISLTDLNISWSRITHRALLHLPRGLTRLDMEFCENLSSSEANPESLPSTLTSLNAPPTFLNRLPREKFPMLTLAESKSEMTSIFDF